MYSRNAGTQRRTKTWQWSKYIIYDRDVTLLPKCYKVVLMELNLRANHLRYSFIRKTGSQFDEFLRCATVNLRGKLNSVSRILT